VTTCPECGATVTTDVDFCPQCDAYLAWDQPGGGRPAGQVPRRSAPAPEAEPRAENPLPVASAVKTDAGPAVAEHKRDEPQAAVALPVITIPPWPYDEGPSTAPSAPDGNPVAVLPGRPAPKAPAAGVAPSVAPPSGGTGVQCSSCGAWNTAGRHFCTACGAEIIAGAPPPPAATPRGATSTVRRRSGGGRIGAVLVVVGIVLAVLIGGFLLRDPLQSFAASAVDRVFGVAAVNPTKVTASGSARGHPATAAHDGASNIAWEPATAGPATGQSLTFAFARPFRLVVLEVLPGAATDQRTFLQSRRPTELKLTIERSGGPSIERTMRLADQPGPQRLDLGIDQVQRVRVAVLQSSGPPNARVAIAEVEFSGR
jgi:hypothetical protein